MSYSNGILIPPSAYPDFGGGLDETEVNNLITSQVSGLSNQITTISNELDDKADKTDIPAAITIDAALNANSTNPVQNKVVKSALDTKQDKLIAGANITIAADGKTISAAGGGGGNCITGSTTSDETSLGIGANSCSNGTAVGYCANGSSAGTAIGYKANGRIYGTAVGYCANGCNYGTAIGANANGSSYGVAIGNSAFAYPLEGAVAVGYNAITDCATPIVIGGSHLACNAQITVSKDGVLKVGGKEITGGGGSAITGSTTSDETSLGIGANSCSNGTAVGYSANGSNTGTAVGYSANGYFFGTAVGYCANGSNTGTAIGYNAYAAYSTAVGYCANGSNGGTAIGNSANGSGTGTVAVGSCAYADCNTPIVIGGPTLGCTAQITVSKDGVLKVGGKEITGGGGSAITGSTTSDETSLGIGANGRIYGTAIGNSANSCSNGTAIGYKANGSNNGTAVGYCANGSSGGTAIGANAQALSGRVAIGYNAYASATSPIVIRSLDISTCKEFAKLEVTNTGRLKINSNELALITTNSTTNINQNVYINATNLYINGTQIDLARFISEYAVI